MKQNCHTPAMTKSSDSKRVFEYWPCHQALQVVLELQLVVRRRQNFKVIE